VQTPIEICPNAPPRRIWTITLNPPDKRSGKWSELMDIALLGPFGDNIKEMAA
jgi:hypothetical protein